MSSSASSTPRPVLADCNPFIAHRRHLDVYRQALARGLDDRAYCTLVEEADERIVAVDGRGFRVTPVVELRAVPAAAAPVMAKVETANVGGSHKARHLFGLLLQLLVDDEATPAEVLAIASCGNAALGAAVVARAADRALRVFVPTDADPTIVARLDALGADVQHCGRRPGQQGDPCVARLHEAVAAGARPFTVQGTVCPDAIDGGRTLGLELASQLNELGIDPAAIYIQIGGGALATATMDGLRRAWPGRPLPRLHPVQAEAAHPYVAAWRRVADRALTDLGIDATHSDHDRAALLTEHRDAFDHIRLLDHRDDAMVPWPTTPVSVASGILDDITYDWRTVLEHQVETGGHPILVPEETFVTARQLAEHQADPAPNETGAAGLAGLLTHAASTPAAVTGPSVVLLTG